MKPVIPCPSIDVLRWFLQHTQVSVVHAGIPILEEVPKDLKEALGDLEDAPDLAVATGEVLSAFTGKAVASGDTLVFRNEEAVARVPGFFASTPDWKLIEFFIEMARPDLKSVKRELIVKAVASQVRRAASLPSAG